MVVTKKYTAELTALKAALHKAGEMARTFQQKGFARLTDKTGGKDPFLTEADLAIDTYLRQTLMAVFPRYGWLSEESPLELTCLQQEYCWVVDPIDGTRGFIDGQSAFSISIGLLHKGVPVLGGVYAPQEGAGGKGVCIYGGVDLGVTLEGHLKKQEHKNSKHILVSVGEQRAGLWAQKKHALDRTPFEGDSFKGVYLEAVGSIAYKIALVAANQADAVISLRPKSLYDVCAGHALLCAAGGVFVEYPQNRPVAYEDVHAEICGLIGGTSAHDVSALGLSLQACN